MKKEPTKIGWSRWAAMIAMLLLVLGCSARKLERIGAAVTEFDNPEYPYRIELYSLEIIRFNPHQMQFDSQKNPRVNYVYVKRRTGRLNENEFRYGWESGPDTPESLRGEIVITESQVVVKVELDLDANGKTWVESQLNGSYPIREKPISSGVSR